MAPTHQVLNQAPPLGNVDLLDRDPALAEGLSRFDAEWAVDEVRELGRLAGQTRVRELGRLANRHSPELRTHDRFGHRIDEVQFHPAWHELMSIGVEAEIHALPWNRSRPGAHVARVAKHYLFSQAEAGVHCPLTMTFSAVPALRHEPTVAETWIPRLTSARYDSRAMAAGEKHGALMGMAMTEKQGGSDVRANTTHAVSAGGGMYRLTGHKWFCSAPMCDGFLTLAHTEKGLTCFLVPRFLEDGSRNTLLIQRLKDKLGNRSNASSEIEYSDTWARRVGPEGRGIPTILDMVSHTRLDCVSGSAGMMRQAVSQALHHTSHRQAFGKRLREQPLMVSVLTDLALENEAATVLLLRLAHAYDSDAPEEQAFRRIATAIAKYWVCKRGIAVVAEAMECLGGNGYVEDSILPRLYREMPVNSIWEGSGNIMCLDVLRALGREPESAEALMAELALASGLDPRLDTELRALKDQLSAGRLHPAAARGWVERLAVALQAGCLLRFSPPTVAQAFLDARLGEHRGLCFGASTATGDAEQILNRAWSEQ